MENLDNTQIEEKEHIEEMEEKTFTQKEVDEIVKKRLSRVKLKNSDDLENLKNELNKKDNYLNCKEYLLNNNYPNELLNIIPTDNFDNFKENVEKIQKYFDKHIDPPMYNAEPVIVSESRVLTRKKRKPKDYRSLED